MRWYTIGAMLFLFILTGCVDDNNTRIGKTNVDEPLSQDSFVSELPNLGEAPELINEVWLNVDEPLRLADLRGKVVLLDMWTFS